VTDLEDLLPARQANLSQLLALLRYTQLVDFAMDAQTRCYYLARPKLTRMLHVELARNEVPVSKSTDQIKAEKAKLETKQAAMRTKQKQVSIIRTRPRLWKWNGMKPSFTCDTRSGLATCSTLFASDEPTSNTVRQAESSRRRLPDGKFRKLAPLSEWNRYLAKLVCFLLAGLWLFGCSSE
jgi:hypothetical protein